MRIRRARSIVGAIAVAVLLAGCGAPIPVPGVVAVTSTVTVSPATQAAVPTSPADQPLTSHQATGAETSGPETTERGTTEPTTAQPSPQTHGSTPKAAIPATPGQFTLALAGDVNFADRTAQLLQANPSTALRQAKDELDTADITMVNLETAITTGGSPAPKQFHFRTPATALTALAAAGVDVATMANNHAVDYGKAGLADTLAAIADGPIPVIGIGADAAQAYRPFTPTVNGVRVAILAASQVHDWTLGTWSATDTTPGIANADSARLVTAVRDARKHADVVIVYLHWGIEYSDCPSADQESLAATLTAAGAAAVVGTHAHVLQGAGWRADGKYVAYGLGNYYWWRSFGNEQDDNGVLTLTFRGGRVIAADFLPTHLDDRGVPLVATGTQRDRILQEWDRVRGCAHLLAAPPAG